MIIDAPALDTTAEPIDEAFITGPADELPAEVASPGEMDKSPQGIRITALTVSNKTAHLAEKHRKLIRRAHAIARDNNWTWDQLTTESKISKGTWWLLWHDKYRYNKGHARAGERVPVDSICNRIARWLHALDRKAITDRAFVETSIFQKMHWTARRAFDRKAMAFIYGEAQMGKTTGAKEIQRRHNSGETYYSDIPPSGGARNVLRTIARDIHSPILTNTALLLEGIVDTLDSTKQLILDNCHRLVPPWNERKAVMRCLDTLLYIFTETNCSVVILATKVFRNHVREGEFFKFLKQLSRRGIYEYDMPDVPPPEDINLIAAGYNLPPIYEQRGKTWHLIPGEAGPVVDHIAATGGFGTFCMRLKDAAELAANEKTPINWSHFIDSHDIAQKMANQKP